MLPALRLGQKDFLKKDNSLGPKCSTARPRTEERGTTLSRSIKEKMAGHCSKVPHTE